MISTVSLIRCVRYITSITSVAAHDIADMVYNMVSQRPIIPMMCIGTPNTTDRLSIRNVIRHIRCCQLWLRRSRNMVSRCISFDFIVFEFCRTKLVPFCGFYPFLPLFFHSFTLFYGSCFLVVLIIWSNFVPNSTKLYNNHDEILTL